MPSSELHSRRWQQRCSGVDDSARQAGIPAFPGARRGAAHSAARQRPFTDRHNSPDDKRATATTFDPLFPDATVVDIAHACTPHTTTTGRPAGRPRCLPSVCSVRYRRCPTSVTRRAASQQRRDPPLTTVTEGGPGSTADRSNAER